MRVTSTMLIVLAATAPALAGVGDPQCKTDHPWYPGELSCSTFERLFKTQAELYRRVTGEPVRSDQAKALASWYWRNLNFFHCTEANEDLWDRGLAKGEVTREFWNGLFGYGFALCHNDHHQYSGEIRHLLGVNRCRVLGVAGHTTLEVWLTGGAYGDGRWALLDHDISTVVFTADGKRLLGLHEINRDFSLIAQADRSKFLPAGLHPNDPNVYKRISWAGYSTGYAAVPPVVHLRAGETLRRYLKPGLDDGQTFAYWGINYMAGGTPGPSRSRTWVNQPEKMYRARKNTSHITGQARYANAVYTYKPDFASGTYKQAVVDESDRHVTFEWYSPYVVAATPPQAARGEKWGIYQSGCTNGLVLSGKMTCPVEVSTDQGKTWQSAGAATDGMDLTDRVKGHHQYLLRLQAGAKDLRDAGLTIRTVCQCGPTVIPRVKAGANRVTYEATGRAVLSAGPNSDQAAAHLVAGSLTGNTLTFELQAPRGAKAVHVYGACRARCGSPPRDSKYHIDCSTDGGKTWQAMLAGWEIVRRKPEPNDWWSQTFPYGDAKLPGVAGPVRVRFTNTGNRKYLRAEAHLVYEVENTSPLTVTFAWKEGGELKQASHTYKASPPGKADASWTFQAAAKPETVWVEYAAE